MGKRIGLFGGSFDPPTKAHLHVAEQLIEQGIVDEVEFVPAYVSFHGKAYGATPSQRIEMLNLLIDNSEYESKIYVNTFEIRQQMNASTCDFVEKFLKLQNKGDEYYFIVGMDNAKMIPHFRNAKKLMNLIPFIVVNRGIKKAKDSGEWYNQEPQIVANIEEKYGNCSSSNIRDAVALLEKEGLPEEFMKNWCTLQVFAYILNNELYGLDKCD